MTTGFLLPDLGEGLTDAEIVRWLVEPGDRVELNQIIAEVETAKALVELPSPIVGVVASLDAVEGATVDVGTCIIRFVTDDEAAGDPADDDDAVTDHAPAAATAPRSAVLVGYGPEGEEAPTGRRRRSASRGRTASASASASQPAAVATSAPTSASAVAGAAPLSPRPRATPPVRQFARANGIDLATVLAADPDGRVRRADVANALAAAALPTPAIAAADGDIRTPISGLRRRTAAAMVRSAFTAPHVTEFITVDVTETVELVAALRNHRRFEGARVTPLLVVARALVLAVAAHPSLNSSWDEAAQEIVTRGRVNLGIAVASPRGLLVPNIPDAGALSLRDLADALAGLADRARAGTTALPELSGGSITITNIGSFGIDSGTPILNPGEAAILCIGAIQERPWAHEHEIALRSVLTLSLSFDHRLVDGAEGSAFLADVAAMLRDPLQMVMR